MKQCKYILPALLMACGATTFVSCDDMLDLGNENILYTGDNTLQSANDTVNTFVGILAQLQKVAVRTNLFGELRGDLSEVASTASTDLKDIADFNVSDDNPYNVPRDYYAVINNCNFFLANANTELSEKRYQNGTAQAYFVLRAEALAVRSIRAWLYLQLGQIYGTNIPVVKEPILSMEDAESQLANAQKMDLRQICTEFIADLEPYLSWAVEYLYPFHGNPDRAGYGGSMPSRMSVIPIQLVLGDLYLWKASLEQNPDLAFQAAKYYYDYIVWSPNAQSSNIQNTGYKYVNATTSLRDHWSFSAGNFDTTLPELYSYAYYYTTHFGATGDEVISAIAMDSVANEGHYNQLLQLYCLNAETQAPASIVPSQPCIDYSTNQTYGDVYMASGATVAQFVKLEPDAVTEDMKQRYYGGDLRLGGSYSSMTVDGTEYTGIRKFAFIGRQSGRMAISATTRDVILYRTGDVYLRMAEALNYAGLNHPGYQKMAYYILALGLDETVMENLVKSICNKADSTAISYFRFPNSVFQTQLSSTLTTQNHASVTYYTSERAFETGVKQIGIHQRGSGFPLRNPDYYPEDADPDVTLESYPIRPAQYVASTGTGSTLLKNILNNNPTLVDSLENREGIPVPETTGLSPAEIIPLVNEYQAQMMAYSARYQANWQRREKAWYINQTAQLKDRQYEVVDSLLNVESALETCFEGFRFGYLMRDAYRHGDPSILANRVGQRNASLTGKLTNPDNWFISWKGLIGK